MGSLDRFLRNVLHHLAPFVFRQRVALARASRRGILRGASRDFRKLVVFASERTFQLVQIISWCAAEKPAVYILLNAR